MRETTERGGGRSRRRPGQPMGDEQREHCTHTHGVGGVHTCFPASTLRGSSVRSLALADKAEFDSCAKKFLYAMATAITLCIFAFLDYQSQAVARAIGPGNLELNLTKSAFGILDRS